MLRKFKEEFTLIEKAVSKIKTEMDQNKNNSYIQVIGGFILQHLDENPGDAERILTEGKTIAKSLDEMRKAAEKKKVGNCAVLTDQEGFEVVLKYFGIDTKVTENVIKASQTVTQTPKSVTDTSDFDIKLEDLL